MKEKILEKLHEIEKVEKIKILFAVESGSRAWKFESKDSDYDVRFVYLRRKADYLKINEVKDTLEYPIEELLDINGWDLKKALALLKKSNAPLLEWMKSPIIYLNEYDEINELFDLSKEYWSKKKLIYHYKSLAKKSTETILKQETSKLKRYFYALRTILSCVWIEERDEQPPMEFEKLLEVIVEGELKNSILKLLKLKKTSVEDDKIMKEKDILNFLASKIKYYDQYVIDLQEDNKTSYKLLNEYFVKTLGKVWR